MTNKLLERARIIPPSPLVMPGVFGLPKVIVVPETLPTITPLPLPVKDAK
jgi:hypothetical protein